MQASGEESTQVESVGGMVGLLEGNMHGCMISWIAFIVL